MARLWIDTNVLRAPSRLAKLRREAHKRGLQLATHPIVYLERVRQLIVLGKKDGVDEFREFIDQSAPLVSERLARESLDQGALSLGQRFRTEVDWRRAKLASLSLAFDLSLADDKRVPMTVDWLMAIEVEATPDDVVVTEDLGPEWETLRRMNPPRALDLEQTLRWLAGLDHRRR